MIRNLKGKLDALRAEQQISQPAPVPKPEPIRESLCRFDRLLYPVHDVVGSQALTVGQNVSADLLACLTQTQLPKGFSPERMLYLDTETTGLSTGAGALAFLVGMGYYEDNHYVVEQYMMEDFDQEPDLLKRLLSTLDRFDTLVTYNGKSFDVPLLEVRYVMNRLHSRLRKMTQLDLLHAARRIYKKRIGSCSLGNMERTLLGIERQGDIPGAEIPECFFHYVKDRDPSRMNIVLEHNRQDIVSMPLLLGSMLNTLKQHDSTYPEDQFSCGRLFLRSDRTREAEECFRKAACHFHEARWELSMLYKKEGRMVEAESLWKTMIDAAEGGTAPYHELAKYYEHTLKRYDKAYALIRQLKETLGKWGIRDQEVDKRYHRLKKYIKGES